MHVYYTHTHTCDAKFINEIHELSTTLVSGLVIYYAVRITNMHKQEDYSFTAVRNLRRVLGSQPVILYSHAVSTFRSYSLLGTGLRAVTV